MLKTLCFSLVLAVARPCTHLPNDRAEVVDWEENLLALASFQLNCPIEQLRVANLGEGHQAGVSGCGRAATYIYADNRTWYRADVGSPVVTGK